MQIIPVIDLMEGQVVHAKCGDRAHYQPIESQLCEGSKPSDIIAALLERAPFKTIYCADLDALMGKGNQDDLLSRLQQIYPDLVFWIDQGLPEVQMSQAINRQIVIGSESLSESNMTILQSLRKDYILSLDFMNETLLGAQSILEDSSLWPEKIILMSLSHVGSLQGPDFERLKNFRKRWPDKFIIAAGGVRHVDDLKHLEDLGLSGVLLASALHSDALSSEIFSCYG